MKKTFTAVIALLMLLLMLPSALGLEDRAGLLTASEQQLLDGTLSQISAAHGLTVEAVTVPALGRKDVWHYANDYYSEKIGGSGVLLLIAEQERGWALIANGTGYKAVNDDAQRLIEEEILPFLKEDRYYDAFARYAALCDEMLTLYEQGEIYKKPFPVGMVLLISLGLGLVVGLITVTVMKGKLKTVRRRNGAEEYTRQGSMKLTLQQDSFLYSNVTRIPKPKSNGSGGGGGGSRGGRSGSF